MELELQQEWHNISGFIISFTNGLRGNFWSFWLVQDENSVPKISTELLKASWSIKQRDVISPHCIPVTFAKNAFWTIRRTDLRIIIQFVSYHILWLVCRPKPIFFSILWQRTLKIYLIVSFRRFFSDSPCCIRYHLFSSVDQPFLKTFQSLILSAEWKLF